MKWISLILFLGSFSCFGQQLKAYWTKDIIQLGEQTDLVISLSAVSDSFQFDALKGDLPCEIHFTGEQLWKKGGIIEIMSFSDEVIPKNNTKTWVGTYRITVWDTGYYRLPEFQLSDGAQTFMVQSPVLQVQFLKKKVNTSLNEVPVTFTVDQWKWLKRIWWLPLLIIVLVVGLFLWNKRKRIAPKDSRSLKEKTLHQIQMLRAQKLWETDDVAHYLAYSRILKSFLGERFELNLMERTSQDTILLIRTKGLDAELVQLIRGLLLESDLVKFGKKASDDKTVIDNLNRLEELVVLLSPLIVIE